MKLFRLMEGIEIIRSKVNFDIDIKNIYSDSRRVTEGGIFVALRGTKRNGNDYIDMALKAGCSCVITDDENVYYEYDKTVLTYNSRRAIAFLWDNFYENPSKKLKIIGITGTNGKTSTAYFTYSILRASGKSVGMISTVKCLINDKVFSFGGGGESIDIEAAMTTPDPEYLYMILHKMALMGVEYAVMEASSHALELSKLYPLEFEVGIFTNLSRDHLDFHKTMENYFLSKVKLFYKCKHALINSDDAYIKRIHRYLNREFTSFGLSKCSDYYAKCISLSEDGAEYVLRFDKGEFNVKANVCGGFTVYNSLAAAGAALTLGIEPEFVCEGIKSVNRIEGRIEKVCDGIFIDYAHTPQAFCEIIKTVRSFSKGKSVTLVFGCGGDRDKTKREIMGKYASRLADVIIVTSDNSRTEDKISIIKDIEKGIDKSRVYYIVPDRRDAIELGVKLRKDGILLILGKGHENYEIDKNGKHYFCETEIIKEAILKYELQI